MSDPNKNDEPVGPGPKQGRPWTYWLTLLLLLSLPVSVILFMVPAVRTSVPWGDDISIIRDMRFDQGLDLSKLFKFSNEHLILFTRITMFVDYALFKGAHLFTTFVAVLLAIFIPLACAASFRYLHRTPPANHYLVLIAALLLTVYCNGEILWPVTMPVLIQHLFTAAFAIAAGYAFSLLAMGAGDGSARLGSTTGNRLAATFVAAAVLAVLSGANGLMIVPAALVVSILLFSDRKLLLRFTRWSLVLPLLALLVVLTGSYLYFFLASQPAAAGDAAPRPSYERLVQFVIHFIGGPFWRESTWPLDSHPNPYLVLAACAAFCALLAWLLFRIWKERRNVTAFEVFHLFLIVYVVLTAIAGSVNRASLSAAEGLNKKYPPTSLLAWLAAISLLINAHASVLLARGTASSIRFLGIAAVAVVLILPSHLIEFYVWRYWRDRLEEAAAMAASGVYNEGIMRRVYYDSAVAYDLMRSVFRPAGSYFMRDFPPTPYPLAERYQLATGAVPLKGRQTTLEKQTQRADTAGYIATGTLPSGNDASRIDSLIAVDAGGNVIGYGRLSTLSSALPKWVAARGPRPDAKWFAAFRPAAKTDRVVIYGVEAAGLREVVTIPLSSPTIE